MGAHSEHRRVHISLCDPEAPPELRGGEAEAEAEAPRGV